MICSCGARLLSQRECLDSDDHLLRHVGEAYLDKDSYFCAEEDDVVPTAWAYQSESERLKQMRIAKLNAAEEPLSF